MFPLNYQKSENYCNMNTHRNVILWLFSLLLTSGTLLAQSGIEGTLVDTKGEPLISSTIRVSTTTGEFVQGAIADFDGAYVVDLKEGTYKVEASYVGYEAQSQTVEVKGNLRQKVDFTLDEALLAEVVVSTSKYEKPAAEETVTIVPIKPNLGENSNNISIDQTIEKVPGVNVVGGQANIRGGSGFSYGAGSRVALLLDGMPILTGDAGFPYWDMIPQESIGQLEIIKGAASALYGSSALNGIINARTAYPTSKPKTKVSLFGGVVQNPPKGIDADGNEFDKQWWDSSEPPNNTGISLFHSRKIGNFDLTAGGYGYREKNWRATEFTRRARVNIGTRYRFKNIEGLSAGLNAVYQYNNNGSYLLWNGIGQGAYELWSQLDTMFTKRHQLILDPYVTYTTNKSKHTWKGRYFKNDNVNNTNQSILSDFIYNEYQYQRTFDSIGLVLNAGAVSQLSYTEAELYRSEDGDSLFNATNFGIYAQVDKKFFDKLNASFGIRYEFNKMNTDSTWDVGMRYKTKDTVITKLPIIRLGLNYQLAEYTYLRASYGQGYRYPTIAERYVFTDLGFLGIEGNPNLQSETGWSAEFGVKQGVKISNWKGFIDGALFWTEYQNMMEFGLSGLPSGRFGFFTTNVESDTRISGAEITIGGQGDIGNWETGVLMGYTYINPIYKDYTDTDFSNPEELDAFQDATGSAADYNILKYRFNHTAKVDIQTEYNKSFAIGIAARYNSFMEAIDQVFIDVLPGVEEWREIQDQGSFVVDARASYQFTQQHRLSILCNNIFNREYTVRPALIESPRNFGLKYTYSIN